MASQAVRVLVVLAVTSAVVRPTKPSEVLPLPSLTDVTIGSLSVSNYALRESECPMKRTGTDYICIKCGVACNHGMGVCAQQVEWRMKNNIRIIWKRGCVCVREPRHEDINMAEV
ncbi:hypothetical protein GWK47_035582 [Chionoecetes opilio]|uniref:Uncharacterized protein n=1 Tax=Chionoecetes opilio TaxID=41210 RepID=A0A8J5CNH5_CHIOP|nr:hypothetical protein GWK47_035582 [Chionoecetes opilio]